MVRGRGKKRLSDERVASVILEYLVKRREYRKPGCTAYDIAKNAGWDTGQRQQRIEAILKLLEKATKVKSNSYERATYYEVTEEGKEWYKEVVKSFFEVL